MKVLRVKNNAACKESYIKWLKKESVWIKEGRDDGEMKIVFSAIWSILFTLFQVFDSGKSKI